MNKQPVLLLFATRRECRGETVAVVKNAVSAPLVPTAGHAEETDLLNGGAVMIKDYYEILGITPEAETGEIKKSYRKLAMKYHPDRNRNDPGCEERLKEINEAYRVLGDEEGRRRYDLFHRQFLKEPGVYREAMEQFSASDLGRFFQKAFGTQKMGLCRGRGFGRRGCRRGMWDS